MLRYLWLVLSTMLLAGLTQAAEINFNGNSVNNCPQSGNTYNCSAFIGSGDTAVIASGYTVVVSGPIQLAWGQGLKMSGTARLETTGTNDINITASNILDIAGGTIKAGGVYTIGGGAMTTANIIAGSVTNNGQKHTVRGSITSTGNVSFATETTITGSVSGAVVVVAYKNSIGGTLTATGDLTLGGESTVSGAVSGAKITVGDKNSIGGSLTATAAITMGGGTTVTGAVSGASITTGSDISISGSLSISGAIVTNSGAKINGAISGASITTGSNNVFGSSLTIKDGNIQLGSGTTVSGAVSGASITADADVKLGSTLAVTGAIKLESRVEVTGAVSGNSIVTNSDVKLLSTLNVKGTITLSSGNTITGLVSGASITTNSNTTLKGGLNVSGLAEIASGNTVTGAVNAGTLTLNPSNATINGNVSVTGNITMGSGTVINGDVLTANNVTMLSSNAKINGNATVNSMTIGSGGSVSKVITCKVPPSSAVCSCVTNNSNVSPTCAAPAPAGAHHFQINHPGSALTCQPRTVTVIACANASCTTPHFTGSSTVTLKPGNKSFTFTGTINSATVEQRTAGSATLEVDGTTTTVCVNSGNAAASTSCTMSFDDTGLQVTVDDQIAATVPSNPNLRIQALAASATKQSCVPLVASKSENINLSCGFINPEAGKARANAQVSVNGTGVTCGNSVTAVLLAFDSAGIANATLTYPEVGQVSLDAAYAGSASFTAKGRGSFIAAPARFKIDATSAGGKTVAAGSTVDQSSAAFAKADEAFRIKFTAVNSLGATTTNFGKEITPENIKPITLAVSNPAGVGNAGAITPGAFNPITNGVSSSMTDSSGAWRFSDVGIILVEVGLTSGTGYLASSRTDFKTTGSQKIGRFTPDHFKTSLPTRVTPPALLTREMVPAGQSAGMTMPCKATSSSPALLSPCDQAFVYSQQPFYVLVKAYNSTGSLTSNYEGLLAKPITLSAADAVGGALVNANIGAMDGSTAGTPPPITFVGGIGKVEDTNYNLPTLLSVPVFRFKALPSATTGTNPLQFFLRAVDTDATTSQRATASNSTETAITAVSGRLVVPNVDGSPSSTIPVTLQAQIYDASRGFVFNPMYNSSARSLAGLLRFNNCLKGLASVCATAAQLQLVAPGTAAFQSGKALFRLSPPTGQYGLGSVQLTVEPQWIDYLPSTTGKLTFGLYRSGPVIYTREVY